MSECAYHPEADAVGACVNCGRLICVECKTVLGGKFYCNPCADKMYSDILIELAQPKEQATYNTTLRVVSGVFGLLFIASAINGLRYFVESGLVAELIVDVVGIIIAIACLLMASIPQWIRANLKIDLQKGSVFGLALGVLIGVYFIVVGLGPEPPGGWWNY